MKKIAVLLLMLMLPLIYVAGASGFNITVYTDKAAWAHAVAGQYITETFTNNMLHDPGLTYTTVMGSIALERYRDVLNITSQHPAQTIWKFENMINAYGGDWTLGGPGGTGNSLVVTLEESGITAGRITSNYYNDFWGFVSDTPFSQIKLTGGTGSNQRSYSLDNMVYAYTSEAAGSLSFLAARPLTVATPLPGSLWLLDGALLSVFGFRKRISC
jgi:hypothetical protein